MSKDIAIHNLRILKHETEEHLKDLQALENKIDEKDFIDYQAQMESEKCNIEALDIAIESLDNEWVDVRDRLPSEDYQDVLVTLQSGNIDIGHIFTAVDTQEDKSERLFFHESQTNENVIAWKPLPKPYERNEE